MNGKIWLWISLGALALVAVCCVGVLIGGTVARQDAPAAQALSGPVAQPALDLPRTAPTESSPEPTLLLPTPTPIPTQSRVPTSIPTQPPLPRPTATAFPTPPPPPAPPSGPPTDGSLQALVDYANAIQPLLKEGGEMVQRDGEILKASEGGHDAVLCDGRLAADKLAMANMLHRVRSIAPPADAAKIHELVLISGDAWTEALDNVGLFCDSRNQLYKIPAVLKFWEAASTLQDAANRFWLLLLAKGVEDWVQR